MSGDQQPIAGLERPKARFAFDLDGRRPRDKRDPLGPILLEPFRRWGGVARRNDAFDLDPGRGKEIEELLILQGLGNVGEQISGPDHRFPSVAVTQASRPTVRERDGSGRNDGGLQSFFASFSKSRLFSSKDFQRKLWRFCGISRGYKGQKPKVSISKFFAAPDSFWSHCRRHRATFR